MVESRDVAGTDEHGEVAKRRRTVIVSSMASDSHTWNLVFLQLLIEELGYEVVNLGPCVPDSVLVEECRRHDPEMVVISSVNGHGFQDGMRVIGQLRGSEALAHTPVVIGGKLDISDAEDLRHVDELMAAGFDGVFEDGVSGVADFRNFVRAIPRGKQAVLEASDQAGASV